MRRVMASSSAPILIALIDDYDVVLTGVAHMLDPYRDRVLVAEIDANKPLEDTVDIALYDSFAQPESDHERDRRTPSADPHAQPGRRLHLELPPRPDRQRPTTRRCTATCPRPCRPASSSKRSKPYTPAHVVISDPPRRARPTVGLDWPGRHEGLTDREAEILALITQGKSNAEVAAADLPQPEHRQVLHPHHLPQDRRDQPYPGRAMGRRDTDSPPTTIASTTGAAAPDQTSRSRICCSCTVVHRGSCLPSWPKFVDPTRQLKSPEASRHRHAWPARDRPQLV